MTATPAQLQVIRLTAELVAPGYASLRHIEELRARLRTALIAMDVEAELAEMDEIRQERVEEGQPDELRRERIAVSMEVERLATQSCPVVSTAESRLDGGEAA